MTVLVTCIVRVKPPYLPFPILLFLPLTRGAGRRLPSEMRLCVAALATILSLVAAWTVLTVRIASVPILRDPKEAGPSWSGLRPAVFDRTDRTAQLFVPDQPPAASSHPAAALDLAASGDLFADAEPAWLVEPAPALGVGDRMGPRHSSVPASRMWWDATERVG